MGGGEEAACLWTRKDRANSGQSSLRAAQANVGFDAGSLGSILARLALRLGIGELLSHAQHAPSLVARSLSPTRRQTPRVLINAIMCCSVSVDAYYNHQPRRPMRFVACRGCRGSREGREGSYKVGSTAQHSRNPIVYG